MTLYKYVDFKDYTIESLKEHYFWLTNPSDLNDASEGQVITSYEITDEQKIQWYKFESLYHYLFGPSANTNYINNLLNEIGLPYNYVLTVMGFYNQDSVILCNELLEIFGPSFPINQIDNNDKKLIASIDEAIEKKRKKNMEMDELERRNLEVENLGIFCLTTNYSNELMWSLYSNGHKGFCIGYEVIQPEDCKKHFLISVEDAEKYFNSTHLNFLGNYAEVTKVEYAVNNRNYNPFIFDINPIINSLFYKGKKWSYEEEYRIVRANMNHLSEQEFRKLHFPKKILKEIIFGYKANQKNIDKIKNIVKNHYGNSVSFFKAKYDFDKNEVSNDLIRLDD